MNIRRHSRRKVFRVQFGVDKAIDGRLRPARILNRRRDLPCRTLKGPELPARFDVDLRVDRLFALAGIGCAHFDPRFEIFENTLGHLVALGRHLVIGFGMREREPDPAFLEISRDHSRPRITARTETESGIQGKPSLLLPCLF